MSRFFIKIFASFIGLIIFTGCFTGIESTRPITNKDVEIAYSGKNGENVNFPIDSLHALSFKTLLPGDSFYVTDSEVSFVLTPHSNIQKNLKDSVLLFRQSLIYNQLGVNEVVILQFADGEGNIYDYNTRFAPEAISLLKIPFMIDLKKLAKAKESLLGRELYINVPTWYDTSNNTYKGQKFVKVNIDDILPGNKVYTYKVKFKYENKEYFQYLSSADDAVKDRSFSSLFTQFNPRNKYPSISDENWELIRNGKIALGMTKDECRLALGRPANLSQGPTYSGMREIWQYSDGVYLVFMDGLLTDYRK